MEHLECKVAMFWLMTSAVEAKYVVVRFSGIFMQPGDGVWDYEDFIEFHPGSCAY